MKLKHEAIQRPRLDGVVCMYSGADIGGIQTSVRLAGAIELFNYQPSTLFRLRSFTLLLSVWN